VKVQFEFTAADLAEVGGRAADRSPLVRKWRVRSRIFVAAILGILVFAIWPGVTELRAIVGILVAVGFYWFASAGGNKARDERLLQVYRERLGGDGPFLCEIEIDEAGILSRQLGSESRHAWTKVQSITEIPGGIEFVYAPMGSLIVRDRAFADASARKAFLEEARSYLRFTLKEKT
jgi:hypothetical protein